MVENFFIGTEKKGKEKKGERQYKGREGKGISFSPQNLKSRLHPCNYRLFGLTVSSILHTI